MQLKLSISALLVFLGLYTSQAQVSYNKKAMGSVGKAPSTADFSNPASLDNVDMTTGTLKIGIPLYEIKVNDISVPITLNYSALGIKVNQEAGVAGMGWELKAGGKIITNIQGKPDDGPYGIFGFYGSIPEHFNINESLSPDRMLLQDMVDNKVDHAWDTYNYILPNGGGTYTRFGATFPYDPFVKIEHTNGAIKTTDGITYQFIGGDRKRSSKTSYYTTNNDPIFRGEHFTDEMTWSDLDLLSIKSRRFGDSVDFKYKYLHYENGPERPRLVAKTRINPSESMVAFRDVMAINQNHGGYQPYPGDQYYKTSEPLLSKTKIEYLSHSILDSIKFPNGLVTFDYYPDILGRDALANIRIFQHDDSGYQLLKRYEFIYDGSQMYGHYLSALRILDDDNHIVSAWRFDYREKLPVIPNQPSKAQDRWGFYNGMSGNKTLLENPDQMLALRTFVHYPIRNSLHDHTKAIHYTRPENVDYYGYENMLPGQSDQVHRYWVNFANRNTNVGLITYGILDKITTPTGGTYTYEYEPHRFVYVDYDVNSGFQMQKYIAGAGVRIASIIKHIPHADLYYGLNSSERTSKKTYRYGDATFDNQITNAEAGWGLGNIPGTLLGNTSAYYYTSGNPQSPYSLIGNLQLLSHPVNDMVQFGGSYVMYRSVTEIINVMAENDFPNHGKTVYYNLPAIPSDQPWRALRSMDNPGIGGVPNPGVKREDGAGIIGYRKFSFTNNEYKPVEEVRYFVTSLDAPFQPVKMRSVFAHLTGQVSGPVYNPGNTLITDNPHIYDGVISDAHYNLINVLGSPSGGTMDYITRTQIGEELYTAYYPGKYASEVIDINTLSNAIKRSTEYRNIFTDETAIVYDQITRYSYDNPVHQMPTKIATMGSKGDSVITRYKYPQDYASEPLTTYMKEHNISLSEPIEEYVTYKRNNKEYVKSGKLNTFTRFGNAVVPYGSYQLKTKDDQYQYNSSFNPSGGVFSSLDTNYFKTIAEYKYYIKGNIHEYTEESGIKNVFFWGYKNQFPIAKVVNARNIDFNSRISKDIAYTSFETNDTCNWIYSGVPVPVNLSPSGKKAYNLISGPVSKINSTVAGKYILSYWYKAGAAVTVTGGTVGAAVVKNQYGDWKLVERELNGIIDAVSISGTGYIDELRFHPADAQMTTYLYEPLIGISATIDLNGRRQSYEYDSMQRLKNIKDQHGNTIKSYRYIYGSENHQP